MRTWGGMLMLLFASQAIAAATNDLRVVTRGNVNRDYDAEVQSGVPLSDAYARERGLDRGLVWMVFENKPQFSYHLPQAKIRGLVRLAVDDSSPPFRLGRRGAYPPDTIDVLDTVDGTVLVWTSTGNAGIFTSSDIYVFPKGEPEAEWIKKVGRKQQQLLREALAVSRT